MSQETEKTGRKKVALVKGARALSGWDCLMCVNIAWHGAMLKKLNGEMNCNLRGRSCRKSGHC